LWVTYLVSKPYALYVWRIYEFPLLIQKLSKVRLTVSKLKGILPPCRPPSLSLSALCLPDAASPPLPFSLYACLRRRCSCSPPPPPAPAGSGSGVGRGSEGEGACRPAMARLLQRMEQRGGRHVPRPAPGLRAVSPSPATRRRRASRRAAGGQARLLLEGGSGADGDGDARAATPAPCRVTRAARRSGTPALRPLLASSPKSLLAPGVLAGAPNRRDILCFAK